MSRCPVLLVEDDDGIREAVAEILNDEGFEVVSASNGRQALDWLRDAAQLPCVIVLDLMMPVMSGEQMLTHLRSTPRLKAIPVVVTSAAPEVPEGISAVLRKPYDLEALLNVVAAHCPN